jgi:predicted adenine nucleotide alpha hydrolase (AANH) superfamily ATPase
MLSKEKTSEVEFSVDLDAPYEPKEYFKVIEGQMISPKRCQFCYRLRLRNTAEMARARGYSHFSTTLLFSRQQKHDVICEEGFKAEKEFGVKFYYEDFRVGHKEASKLAQELKIYRQKYCGCTFGASGL